jgi:MOSC domain-containing protein YiiM
LSQYNGQPETVIHIRKQGKMPDIVAVCTSQKKGMRKKNVGEGVVQREFGFIDDAHADYTTHRQVSLLAMESIQKMRELGVDVGPGDFAENLTTEGIELVSLPVGTQLLIGNDILLEVSQIGKECHTKCAIYYAAGRCIMPEEGIFTRVINGGYIRAGDSIRVQYGT